MSILYLLITISIGNSLVTSRYIDKSIDVQNSYSNIDWFCSPTDSGIKIFTKGNLNGKDIS